jgi:hypothetical protein
MDDILLLTKKLETLKAHHQALDDKINQITLEKYYNELEVQRLKREKLQLRDEITSLEYILYPDISA